MTELYKSLVEPSHSNCATIQSEVNKCLAKARNIFGDNVMNRVSDVLIEFFDKGRCAAVATYGKHLLSGKGVGLIQFSMRLTVKRIITMIKEIIPHEIAHVICMANKWDMGHGRIWKQVCMMLGGNGETSHTMQTMDGRLKNLYEAQCESGHVYWLTGPQKRIASRTGIQATNLHGAEVILTKRNLTGNIMPIT